MTTLAQNLAIAMSHSDRYTTQEELAAALGVSQTAIHKVLTGETKQPRYILKMAKLLNVDPDLLTTTKNAFSTDRKYKVSNTENNTTAPITESPNTYQVHSKPVPLISSVAAGNWKDIGNDYDPKDEQDWVLSTVTTGENAFALRIQGDSMEPDIKDNEIVIVDPQRITAHNSIVIVIQNGNTEATCKQLVVEGGKRYLKPINPRYPIMEMQEDARICGVVVQSLKTWV